MKIGVILVAYEAPSLNRLLAPWMSCKRGIFNDLNELVVPPLPNTEIVICAVSAVFQEYYDLGVRYDNRSTEKTLLSYKEFGEIDEYITIKDKPIIDFQSRSAAWGYLKDKNVDVTIQLDSDEFYSLDDVVKLISYIESNPFYDYYRINFKNYFGQQNEKTYVLDFKPVRVIWNNKHGGIKDWIWDNDVSFKDGTRTPHCAGKTIPINICHPTHYSWVGDKNTLIRKINYQLKCLGCCSYKWSEEQNKLVFNEPYYASHGLPLPDIYID